MTGDDEPKPEEKPEQSEEEQARAAFYGAPEGEYEIGELPEGMEIDKEALEAVTPIAKELNLSNEGFAKIVDVYANKVMPGIQDRVVGTLQQDIAAQHAAWANEALEAVRTDDTYGGKPLADVKALAAKSLDRFGGEDFRKFLDSTGLGNHPAMLKFAYLAGTMLSEDTTFERGGTPPTTKSRTEKYYGS